MGVVVTALLLLGRHISPTDGLHHPTSLPSARLLRATGRVLHHPSYSTIESHLDSSSIKVQSYSEQKEGRVKSQAIRSSRNVFIRFSRAFQRHAVYQQTIELPLFEPGTNVEFEELDMIASAVNISSFELVASYEFLDDAMKEYPSAQILPVQEDASLTIDLFEGEDIDQVRSIAGCGIFPMISVIGNDHHAAIQNEIVENLASDEDILTPSNGTTSEKYDQVMDILTRGRSTLVHEEKSSSVLRESRHNHPSVGKRDGMYLDKVGLAFTKGDAESLIDRFPHICSYEIQDIEDRIRFMLGEHVSQGRSIKVLDHMKLMKQGHGCGFSISQATKAIEVIPELLAMWHEHAKKPSIIYFYKYLTLPSETANYARTELSKHLIGCDISDTFAFGYLYHIGIGWDQIRRLLDAFPTLTYCDVEPNWDLYQHGPVRSELKLATLIYLRKRLQISNSHLYAMLKTHTRLSTYSTMKSHHTLNAIETRLGLSSSELRRLVLRMPSVVGMGVNNRDGSVSALDKRIDFFTQEVDMSLSDLKEAILKQPSLLQYSVESSLRPKIVYFQHELGITKISRVICFAPAVMGLSLQHNIRPKCTAIMEKCELSTDDFAKLIETVPSVLKLSLKRKIEPCFSFLCKELHLITTSEVKNIILKTPRVLLQSVETSLLPKVQILKEALIKEANGNGKILSDEKVARLAAKIFVTNPSLLATTNSILQTRIERYLNDPEIQTLADGLKPRNVGRKRIHTDITISRDKNPIISRKKKSVIEIENGIIVNSFGSVKEAAKELGLSTSSVYTACSTRKLLKGRQYRYGNDKLPVPGTIELDVVRLKDELFIESSLKPLSLYDMHVQETDTVSIIAFASGSVYPSDDINTVRGTRCAGGLAIKFPQVGVPNLHGKFDSACKQSFGMIMPESFNDGSNLKEGLVLLGFPFLNPSRNRCDLYALHGALKVVLQLLKIAAKERSMALLDVNVDIYSDSSYAWKILNDDAKVINWGSSSENVDEFLKVFDGNCPTTLANPDLLFPLCKTASRIVHNEVKDQDGKDLCVGKNIKINFLHCNEVLQDGSMSRLNLYARKAAMWQFQKR